MGSPRSLHVAVHTEALTYLTSGTSVDLVGVAGSGRSHVLSEVRLALLDTGWTVLVVHGVAALRDRPLEPLAVAGLTSRPDRRAQSAVAGAVAAIEEAVRPDRTLVLVDDADDLDRVSVGALVAAHARSPFVVLSASRPLPRRLHDAQRLSASVRPGVEVPMPALGYVDTQTLLADLLPGPVDGGTLTRVYAAAGGLPGLVRAIVASARRRGHLTQVRGTWTASEDMWSPQLARSIEPLLQDLSPDAVDGLEALSIAGPVELPMARTLVSWDVLDELDACRLLRFVPAGGGTVVGVFPQIVGAHFRHLGTSARNLRLDERLRIALGTTGPSRAPSGARPLAVVSPTAVPEAAGVPLDEAPWETDTVRHRMLLEHWYQETVARRADWEADPSPSTAVQYLRTLLVGSSDDAALLDVVARTPRIGDRRIIATLDNWHALIVAFVEKDLDGALAVLHAAGVEAGEWAPLLDSVGVHLSLYLAGAPKSDPVGAASEPVAADVTAGRATVRAEWLVFRGDPARALTLVEGIRTENRYFSSTVDVLTGLAILLEARLDDADSWTLARLDECRTAFELDDVHGHAFVRSVVLLLQCRTAELWQHLGTVLSTGLFSALQRPYQSGNLAIAAAVALFEDRTATAQNLAHQARALGLGPSPLPAASSTWTDARLATGHSGFATTSEPEAASLLWAEHEDLHRRGFLIAAMSAGAFSLDLDPDPDRAQALLLVLAQIPAALARHVERFVTAVAASAAGDPDVAHREAVRLLESGQVLLGARAFAALVRGLRRDGDPHRAAQVLAEARTLLAPFGPGALGGLVSLTTAHGLTAREREIAELAVTGLSNKEVADRLHLSVRTVENHLHRTFRKLGVDGRAALAHALAE